MIKFCLHELLIKTGHDTQSALFVFVLICHYIMMDNIDGMRGRGHNRKWTYFNPRTEAGVEAAVEAGAGHTHCVVTAALQHRVTAHCSTIFVLTDWVAGCEC